MRHTKKGKGYNMLEIVGKFLDSLYETSKSCDNLVFMNFKKSGTRIMDMW